MKIHKLVRIHNRKIGIHLAPNFAFVLCGRNTWMNGNDDMPSTLWKNVTCRHCLKKKKIRGT